MARRKLNVRTQLASRGADVVLVTVRELRLLLGLLLVLFVTSETWRYVGQLSVTRLVLLAVGTVIAALLVVVLGLRRVVARSVRRRATAWVVSEVVAFGAALFVLFVGIGVVSIDAVLAAQWSELREVVLFSFGIGDPPLVLTRPLLQVATFLACLGVLAFAIEVIADRETRDVLLRDLAADTRGRVDG